MERTKLVALIVAAVVMVTASAGAASPAAAAPGEVRPYVVTFDPAADVDQVLMDLERNVSMVITRRFDRAVKGAVVQTGEVPEAMAMVPGVASVERDSAIELPPVDDGPVAEAPAPGADDPSTEDPGADDPGTEDPGTEDPGTEDPGTEDPETESVLWGLDRIDQRELPLSNSYSAPSSGEGVTVYVMDTGVSPHQEFGARLATGVDVLTGGPGNVDCEGHGTHVAGTIGGEYTGVAPGVSLVPVRVMDCEGAGTVGDVVEGFEWILENHPQGAPAVINMSLGGEPSEAEHMVIDQMTAFGFTIVTSAGNDSADACAGSSGAGLVGAIVVGSTEADDRRSDFSNVGSCVDLFAPGGDIASTSNLAADGYTFKSGTSMSAPHVSGAAAVLLGVDPWRSPQSVEATLTDEATQGVVIGAGTDSPNRLLYSDPARTATPAPPVEEAPALPAVLPEVEGAVTDLPVQVTTTPPSSVDAAVLAFTGGDPRALLLLSLMMVAAGAWALSAGRRRERQLLARLTAAESAERKASSPLQLMPKRR